MPVITATVPSDILRGNPLGDPVERRTPVYVPPEYETSPARYPVVYLLAGFGSRGTHFLNEAAWAETMPERLDRLTAAGAIRPMIVVMPDCMTCLGGSQYLNSSATGRYEDYLVAEVVPWVDTTFRTRPDRTQRAVAGRSSGGYGATVLAMRHPDVFGLAVDHAGDKYFELCYKTDIPKCLAGLAAYGRSPERFLQRFPHPPEERGTNWFEVVNLFAMSACYSPNPATSIGFDLPFDPTTGELRNDVWARWLAHDPITLAARHVDALRALRLYFLDCGRRDEYHLQYGSRIYSGRLTALGIPHRFEEFDGGHRDTAYRFDVSLRALSETFDRPPD